VAAEAAAAAVVLTPCCSAGQGVESTHLSPSFSPPPYVIALVVFVGLPCELEWMGM
jgi:hypothetical protein